MCLFLLHSRTFLSHGVLYVRCLQHLIVSLATQPSLAVLMALFILIISWHHVRFESSLRRTGSHSRNYSYVPEFLRLTNRGPLFPLPTSIESYSSCSTPGRLGQQSFLRQVRTLSQTQRPRPAAIFLGPRDTRQALPQQLYHSPRDNTQKEYTDGKPASFSLQGSLSLYDLRRAHRDRHRERGNRERRRKRPPALAHPLPTRLDRAKT